MNNKSGYDIGDGGRDSRQLSAVSFVARADLDIEDLLPWIEVRFSRSPGPGGQNVNKVSTRVTLLFNFVECPLLTDAQKRRVGERLATRISRDGRLRVVSRGQRTQRRNRSAAETRLLELLSEAMRRRKPRQATRPTAGARRRRLDEKRQRGELKRQRRPAKEE